MRDPRSLPLTIGDSPFVRNLLYAGRSGTGGPHGNVEDLHLQLDTIRTLASPFAKRLARADAQGVRFVRTELVAEVRFRGWTGGKILHHASFQGLR